MQHCFQIMFLHDPTGDGDPIPRPIPREIGIRLWIPYFAGDTTGCANPEQILTIYQKLLEVQIK